MDKEKYENLNMSFSTRTDIQIWLLLNHFL